MSTERNLADEFMPPSARVGDAEARRLGLMMTGDRPVTPADIDTRIQAIDAREHAPEALVERMARAMWAADCGHSVEELSGATPEPYVRLAAAALRVVTERADGGADEPPVKVGDPDPSIHTGRYCGEEEAEDGYCCTRQAGHPADWHIAGDHDQVCAVWPAR